MSTATHDFTLRPSRIQWLIQATFLIMMLYLWWQLLQPLWMVLCTLMALLSWGYWLRRVQVSRLTQLDGTEWTVLWQAAKPLGIGLGKNAQQPLAQVALNPTRSQLKHVSDHGVYMVLQFDAQPNVVIWRDQVPFIAWKQLKILAKLH